MRLILSLLFILFWQYISAQNEEIIRIDPPHWWVGMQNKDVQLMVYGPEIATWDAEVKNKRIKLTKTQRVINPNYLFLTLNMSEDVESGAVKIRFTKENKSFNYNYELREKKGSENRIMGLDQSDLMYLIMPDRFANAESSNDQIPGMADQSLDRSDVYKRHGGDLKGITQRLDYLEDLGITALWLNPVLANDQPDASYHGYAITDHYEVDARFGGNAAYFGLIEEMHSRGIKMVMDMIHNHSGDQHWIYKDPPMPDWVHIWPEFTKTTYRATTLLDPYASEFDKKQMLDGWFDEHMPDLNQTNPFVASYLIQNAIWWIEEAGIDAYRMDTWAYSDPEFLEKWVDAVLTEYPDFGIFGETWVHGGLVQSFFHGKTKLNKKTNTGIPSLTDFQLYYAINDALTKEQGWTDGVAKMYYTLAKDYVYEDASTNVVFLDNHDLNRYMAAIGNDPGKFKMGLDWLMTVRGIPMLFYGTELGFNQETDFPHGGAVRVDMPGGWEGDSVNVFEASGRTKSQNEYYNYLSSLGKWRAKTPVLHQGKLMQFVPNDGLYVFFRYDEEEAVMVIMNCSSKPHALEMARYAEIAAKYAKGIHPVTGRQFELKNLPEIQPWSSMILELMD